MPPIPEDQNQQLCTLMRQAGQQAQQMSAQPFEVTAKGPEDFVTNVDRMLDRLLATQCRAWFPHAGVITEEDPASWQALTQDFPEIWLIDPLDGTEDFIQGRSNYAVMIGLLRQHQPQAGWVYSPSRDRIYWGGPGWGLFQAEQGQAPQPLLAQAPHISAPAWRTQGCAMVIGDRDRHQYGAALQAEIPNLHFIGLGSFGLKVLEVILGHAGLYIYLNGRVKLWDTVGPLALAQAAGLRCCDITGTPIQFTPDALNPNTLAHHQSIVVAWPDYFDQLQAPIQAAIRAVKG